MRFDGRLVLLAHAYLAYVEDPSCFDYDDAVAELERRLAVATDERQQMYLRGMIHLHVDAARIAEEAFVAGAKAWAEDARVTAESLLARGVPAEVLRKAGFDDDTGGATVLQWRPPGGPRQG